MLGDDCELVRAEIAAIFKSGTQAHWTERLDDKDCSVAPVLTMGEAPDHPHNRERRTFAGTPAQPAPGPRFSNHSGGIRDTPALPDAERTQVFADWGL